MLVLIFTCQTKPVRLPQGESHLTTGAERNSLSPTSSSPIFATMSQVSMFANSSNIKISGGNFNFNNNSNSTVDQSYRASYRDSFNKRSQTIQDSYNDNSHRSEFFNLSHVDRSGNNAAAIVGDDSMLGPPSRYSHQGRTPSPQSRSTLGGTQYGAHPSQHYPYPSGYSRPSNYPPNPYYQPPSGYHPDPHLSNNMSEDKDEENESSNGMLPPYQYSRFF